MAERAGGTILAFPTKGPADEAERSQSSTGDLGGAIQHLASAARCIADSALAPDERAQVISDIGLLASRIARMQVDTVERNVGKFDATQLIFKDQNV